MIVYLRRKERRALPGPDDIGSRATLVAVLQDVHDSLGRAVNQLAPDGCGKCPSCLVAEELWWLQDLPVEGLLEALPSPGQRWAASRRRWASKRRRWTRPGYATWRVRWAVQRSLRWRPWYTVRFYGGPLDSTTRRTWRGGWVYLDERGEPVQDTEADSYWLLHEVEGKRLAYGWDTEESDDGPCPCCGPMVLVA